MEEESQQTAHIYFSAHFFNTAWEHIDAADRSADQTEAMILAASASLAHWLQRDDVEPVHISVGRWQMSRVQALAGHHKEALYWAERCLQISDSHELPAFYRAYAHEAVARAYAAGQDFEDARRQLQIAQGLAADIEDPDWKALLEHDLAELSLHIGDDDSDE